jgi:acyl-CoA thioesterase
VHDDAEFLGLAPGAEPGRFQVDVVDRLTRLDGQLYGGAAIALSVAAAETVSERPALWMTTQYVSTVAVGDRLDVHAEVLAAGRRTNQVRVTGFSGTGEVVFASLGASGHLRPDGLTGEFERCPVVSRPDDSDRWSSPFSGMAKRAGVPDIPATDARRGFGAFVEFREPTVDEHPDPGPGRSCLWIRRRDGAPVSRAIAAYLADMVPMSLAHALGVLAIGTSLDNTIRLGPWVETDWVLLDLRPHLAVGGYGHGVAHVWSTDGHLLATASQTASLIAFEPEQIQADLAVLADQPDQFDQPDQPGSPARES